MGVLPIDTLTPAANMVLRQGEDTKHTFTDQKSQRSEPRPELGHLPFTALDANIDNLLDQKVQSDGEVPLKSLAKR